MLTFYRLAQNTFKECVREPIYFLMLVAALFLIGMFPTLSLFVFREQVKLVIDSSMATTMLFGLVASALCASHTISREMKNGTVMLLLSKPVRRWSFILAKVLGIMAALSVFVFICASASFVAQMIAKEQFQLDFTAMYFYYGVIFLSAVIGGARNYLTRAPFSSTAIAVLFVGVPLYCVCLYLIRGAPPDEEAFIPPLQLLPALLMLFPAVWTMGAVTVALSPRFELVTNLTASFLIFLLGLVSKYLVVQWMGGWASPLVQSVFGAALPNWQYFWMADALASKVSIPWSYVSMAFIYAALYIGVWTAWAMALFHGREVARDTC